MPAKIFAMIPGRALGDFVIHCVMLSSIRELFDDGELYIYYRNDRPYKKAIVGCMRNVTAAFVAPADAKALFPLDVLDPFGGRVMLQNEMFEKNRVKDANIIIAGSMLSEKGLHSIPLTTLRPPPEMIAEGDKKLVELGLDPGKWFACIHWKEPGYEFRFNDPKRTIFDPEPYIAVIRHIVENLGGQVVRLGHQTNVDIPQLKGVVDLAKVPGTEWLQLYANSSMRFFIGSGSGPASYGPAFGVPTVNTDQNLCLGCWNDDDYIVSQGIIYDGKVYRQTEAYDAGCLLQEWKPEREYKLLRNTAAELIAAADEMYNITKDCIGWRQQPEYKPKLPRPNALTLPIQPRYRRELLIPPSQRKRPATS